MATVIQVAKLVAPIVADTQEFGKALASATDEAKSWSDKVGTVVKAGAAVMVTAAASATAAVAGIGAALGKLAIEAAPLEGIGIAFEKMSEDVGLSLDDLRKAAANTVSDFDLMKAANVALTGAGEDLGKAMGQELPSLLEIARAAARATGQDVDFLFNSLVSGVKRSSPMLIDNTGLVLKLGEANEALAAQLGKTVEDLTAEEKQIALLNATVAAGQKMVDSFGGGQETAAEQIAQFKTQIQNAKDQIGIAFIPALQALLEPILDIAEGAGPKLVEWAQTAGDWLGVQLPRMIDVLKNLLSGDFEDAIWGVATIISETFGRDAAVDFLNFTDGIKDAIEKAKTTLSDIKSWIDTNWPPIQEVILTAAEAVKKWFDKNWPKIRDAVLDAVEDIKAWFDKNWPIIQAVVLTAWEVIQDIITAVIERVVPAVQEFVATIGEHLKSFEPAIEALKGLWESLAPVLEVVLGIIGALILIAVGIIVGLFEGLLAALGPIIDGIAGVIEGIATTLSGILDFATAWRDLLVALFTGTGDEVAEAWEKMKDAVVKIVTGLWSAIDSLFTGAMAAITALVMGFIEGIIGFFTNLWENLVGESLIPEMLESILNWFDAILADIIGVVTTFVSDAIAWFIDLKDRAIATVSQMLTDIFNWFKTTFDDIVKLVGDKIQEIIDGIVGKVQDFFDAGWALMDSLREGIMGMADQIWQDIMNWLNDLIQSIWDKIKNQAEGEAAVVSQSVAESMAASIIGAAHIPAMAAVEATTGGITSSIAYNYEFNQTIHDASPAAARMGFEEMRALVGA